MCSARRSPQALTSTRNLGHGEDPRYAALRKRDGARFSLRSLHAIFGVQALIAWIVTLPALGAAADTRPPSSASSPTRARPLHSAAWRSRR